MSVTDRPARPGELCTCGRPARVVFLHGSLATGYCGLPDGGARNGPCPFCGQGRHEYRCPDYTLTGPTSMRSLRSRAEPQGRGIPW
jgi:hypothetical protein